MSRARPIHPGVTYLVTRRTERRHCLLRPDHKLNQFIAYALIVSASRHGILLHAFCAMSTHLHYVVTDPLGKLPRFLEMFHRLVALGVKELCSWDGAVWDRSQTNVVALCTRQAIIEKIAYTLTNPVQAGLVWSANEWPGTKTLLSDIGHDSIKASRPREYFNPKNSDWGLDVQLDVSVPPSIDANSVDDFCKDILAEIEAIETAAHKRIAKHCVLGAKRAMKISPHSRITSNEASHQPTPAFAVGRGNPEALAKEKHALRQFRAEYRKAFDAWRTGNRTVEFPAGTYAMRVLHAARVRQP